MSTRQSRRAQARGNSGTGGPQKNDPMKAVYVGFGVAILLVILLFAAFTFKQRRDAAVLTATPTPGPNASSKAIQIHR